MAKQQSVAEFMEKERDRLSKAREAALTNRAEIERELGVIERELRALSIYEQAKRGKLVGSRRGERRKAILDVIKQHRASVSRGEILTMLGLKGDKSGEQSVSNALTDLKKSQKVRSREGKYVVL